MRGGILGILLILSFQVSAQLPWVEDFSQGDGTTVDNGTTSWSTSYSGTGTFSVQSNQLVAENTVTEAVWTSEIIDISSVNYAEISVNFSRVVNNGFLNLIVAQFRSDPDYIRFYYKLDGGSEILFYEHISEGIDDAPTIESLSKVLKGTSLQIIIRVQTTLVESRGCFFGCSAWEPYADDYYSIDEVSVSEVTTFYSRADGNWRDGNSWSLSDFSGSQPAVGAGVYPTSGEGAIIGNGNTITINNTDETAFLEVRNTGTLNLNSNMLSITRGGGGIVENGGNIQNTNTNSILEFADPFTTDLVVDNNSGINIGRLRIADGVMLNVSGSGSIRLNNNLEFTGAGALVDFEVSTTISGAITTTGEDNQLINNNTLRLTGNLNSGTTRRFYLDNSANSTIIWSGQNFGSNVALTSNTSGSLFQYNRSGNQNIVTPQDAYHNLTISGSGTKTAQGSFEVNGDATISGTSTFNMDGNNLTLAGNLTNNGTSSTTNIGRLTFDGTSDQLVNGLSIGQIDIDALTLNKTIGTEVILFKPVRVTDTDIVFTSGTIQTNAINILTINDGVTTNNGNTNSYIDGPVVKVGDDAFVFPIGDNGHFAPIEMSGPQNFDVSTQFTAQYINATPPLFQSLLGGFSHISEIEYWNLSRTSDTGNDAACYVGLYFYDEAYSQIDDPADLIVTHYNSLLLGWEDLGAGSISTNSVRSQNRVSNFSPFTFGSSGGINPLPIVLKDFDAEYKEDNIEITWTTATELNNDFFTIERSADGLNYQKIGTVQGYGTTNIEQSYSFIDVNYDVGHNYYRLKQTDFDGTFEVFRPVYLNVPTTSTNGQLVIYPNPVSGSKHLIYLDIKGINLVNEGSVEIQILNSFGKKLMTKHLLTSEVQKSIELNLGNSISTGIYFVKLLNGSTFITKKIVVK